MVELPTWVIVLGFVVGTGAYLFTRIREGTGKAENEALSLAKQTVEFLRGKVTDLEKLQTENASQITVLQADNKRLLEENERLTNLVMGNEVPTALQEFLKQMHDDTMERIGAAEQHMVQALGSMTRAFSDDLRSALGKWDGETERRNQ